MDAREKARIAARETYAMYKEAGICTTCGSAEAVEGQTNCIPCRDKRRIKMTKLRNLRYDSGLCQACGKKPVNIRRRCSQCKGRVDYVNKWQKMYYRMIGRCIYCGDIPMNHTFCSECNAKKQRRKNKSG